MTPQEIEARTAEALKGIEPLNSVAPAPETAPLKDEPAPSVGPSQGDGALAEQTERPEPDARKIAVEERLLKLQVELVAADVSTDPGVRRELSELLESKAALDENGEPVIRSSGKPLCRESVRELYPQIVDRLSPPRGVPGAGTYGPAGEVRGTDPNEWLDSQPVFEKNKKAIRARGLK